MKVACNIVSALGLSLKFELCKGILILGVGFSFCGIFSYGVCGIGKRADSRRNHIIEDRTLVSRS